MFIEKEDRLSQAAPPRRSSWDGGSRRRAPRNWQKTIRLTLYGVIGVLAGLAALAGVGLFLDHGAGPAPLPRPVAAPAAEIASVPAVPTPEFAPPPPPAAAPVAPPDPANAQAVQTLQQQIREANSALAGLRTEEERLRQGLSEAARQREAAAQPGPSATSDAPGDKTAIPETAWADAERTIQALAQHEAAPAHVAVAVPALPPRAPVTPAPVPPPATLAANALPDVNDAVPAMPRPRVVLHYQAGSAAGQQTATDIAQRLLFSNFVYADTRTIAHAPATAAIHYFYPEDQPAAERLAALLGGTNIAFQVVDATNQPGRAKHGTLDVWIGR